MTEILKPDICVIGGGPAGIAAAVGAAAFGVPVVLVERDKMGAEHLHDACLSSKVLSTAARHMQALREMKTFGINVQRPKVDFFGLSDHIEQVAKAVAPNRSAERLPGLGIKVLQGTAQFKNPRTVAVGNDLEINARRFIIATGSAPAVPSIPGLEQAPYFTEASILDLRACPKHLVVVGAGSIGLELAQAYRRLGAAVTVLEAAQPLSEDDAECAAILLEQLQDEGIAIRPDTKILQVKSTRAKVQLLLAGSAGQETVEASHLLLAAGRAPNIGDLNLAAAKVGCRDGKILVDRGLRTTNGKVYAIGDVVAGRRSVHTAHCHAAVVIRNALFRLPARVNKNQIPRVIYTEPELAQVGATEAEARQRRMTIRILRWPYRENDRARAQRQTTGHIKVITTKRGKVLGAAIVGAQASELIAAWTLAVSRGMNIRAFADLVVPHPTFGEIGKQAAISYFYPSLARPWIKRIISFLRLLG